MNFGSHLHGVVALAAELVNVGTPGDRQGRAYLVPKQPELTAVVTEALRRAQPRTPKAPEVDCAPLLDLAAVIRPVFVHSDRGDQDAAAAAANLLLDRYRPVPTLARHHDEPWHLHFHGPARSDPSGWGGAVAVGLATVIGSEYANRLGVCAAPSCDRVFVDVSRNGARRFCSESCQNRVKVAAHRARMRG